jgi:large repetitive protein
MRVSALLIAVAFSLTSANAIAARPGQTPSPASMAGTASDASGHALSNATVQLRSVSTGQLTGTTTSNAAGEFSFSGLTPGSYVVEVTNSAGQIVGTSGSITVGAGATVTGVAVTTSAAAATTAGSAAAVAAHGLSTHATLILGAAAAAGVAGGVAVASGGDASPPQ